MNHAATIFLGVMLTFASAWLGLVFLPYLQLGNIEPAAIEGSSETYPKPLGGLAAQGRGVYIAGGCVYCHTQQIRPEGFGADIERGWGPRRTVARDYIYDRPHLMGTNRTGPDLVNIGARQPSSKWHHLHLYNPRITSPGSVMPSFRYLYEKRKITGEPSKLALELPEEWKPEPGYEIVPTDEARALVAYLQALDHTTPLKEAETP